LSSTIVRGASWLGETKKLPLYLLLAKGPRRNHAAHQPVGLGVGLCKLCLSA